MKPKIGDMAYVPSETYVYQYSEQNNSTAQKYERLKEPRSLLVIGERSSFYEVLMFGSSWYVSKKDVYEIKKEVKSDCQVG
jgi:hypothetical protein